MEISIIVPVYNVEDKLERCIQSILNQSFTDFELILVDDGSADRSYEICTRYQALDTRVKAFHQKNLGVSATRNNGIKYATGRYVVFVDSDDFVEDGYLSSLIDGAKKTDSELIISGVKFCGANNIANGIKQANDGDYNLDIDKTSASVFSKLLDERRFNYVYAKLFVKNIITKNLIFFDESIGLGEDTIFVMQYLKYVKSVFIIGESYYNYIKYPSGTLSSTFDDNQYKKFTIINNCIESTFQQLNRLEQETIISIDRRRIESAYWTIDAILNDKTRAKAEKIKVIDKILKTQELEVACNRFWISKTDLPYAIYIKGGNAKKLYNKIKSNVRKNRIKGRFIGGICKLTPVFIRNWRRKWKRRNVQ